MDDLRGPPTKRVVPAAERPIRQAGTLYLVLGVLGFNAYLIRGNAAHGRRSMLVLLIVVLTVGALLRSPVGRRLTGYWGLLNSAFGLGLVAFGIGFKLITPVPTGIYFILIFLWIGLWQPPGTALRFAPVGVVAYLIPFAFVRTQYKGELADVVIVVAASVFVAEILARQARSVRIAQAEQAEALLALSRATRTDDLTGLGNRRLGNELLDKLTADDAVVVLDLDHFKQVNDNFGHARGDKLLQELGDFLKREVRTADTVARMGGEEFLVVLRGATNAESVLAAERLITAWQRRAPLATLSAGVAIHADGQSPSVTYSLADRALYRAKEEGRSRMVLAGPAPPVS